MGSKNDTYQQAYEVSKKFNESQIRKHWTGQKALGERKNPGEPRQAEQAGKECQATQTSVTCLEVLKGEVDQTDWASEADQNKLDGFPGQSDQAGETDQDKLEGVLGRANEAGEVGWAKQAGEVGRAKQAGGVGQDAQAGGVGQASWADVTARMSWMGSWSRLIKLE